MINPEVVDEARRLLGAQLAARRRAAGLSQAELAPRVAYGRSTVGNVETGRQNVPRSFWSACDEALGTGGELVAAYEDVERLRRAQDAEAARVAEVDRLVRARTAVTGTRVTVPGDAADAGGAVDSVWEVELRRRRMGATNVDEAKLHYLEAATLGAIAANESQAPQVLAPRVRHLRHHVDELLQGPQHPGQRTRLYAVGVHLSGLLGALALDLGQWSSARSYGLEAFDLAAYLEDRDLQAWARATQSLIEYYAGNYHDALAYARDGQRLAAGGPQRVRLAVNGEARALAKLGDAYGVDEAVSRGFAWLHGQDAMTGVSPSLAVEPYCTTRANANAATAYVVLGRSVQAEAYVKPALVGFDMAGMHGPQALSRLDLARVYVQPGDRKNADLDQACQLAREALAVAHGERFESVAQRAEEFLRSASHWSNAPAVREVAELVSSHRERPALEA